MNENHDNTTGTFNMETTAHLLGVAEYTVGHYIRCGRNGVRLDALRGTGRAWRISAYSVAVFLFHRDGSLVVPVPTAAFGSSVAPDVDALAVRLGLFAPPRGFRGRLNPDTMTMTTLYIPDDDEVEHHNRQLTLQQMH